MVKFPMSFEATASSKAGIQERWDAKADEYPPIVSAIPADFGGPGGGYSPEDLFALALINCLIATFKVYAEKSGVVYEQITAKANLTLDKSPSGTSFLMTQVDITFDITGAQDKEKTRKILETSLEQCAVSNSIKSGKTYQINIS